MHVCVCLSVCACPRDFIRCCCTYGSIQKHTCMCVFWGRYLCKQNCVCICVGWCVRVFVRIYYLCRGGITVLVCSCGQELLLYSQSNQPAVLCANKQGTAINTDIKHVPLWRVCVFKSVCKRKEERERKTRKSVELGCSLKQNITAMCHSWG